MQAVPQQPCRDVCGCPLLLLLACAGMEACRISWSQIQCAELCGECQVPGPACQTQPGLACRTAAVPNCLQQRYTRQAGVCDLESIECNTCMSLQLRAMRVEAMAGMHASASRDSTLLWLTGIIWVYALQLLNNLESSSNQCRPYGRCHRHARALGPVRCAPAPLLLVGWPSPGSCPAAAYQRVIAFVSAQS